MNFFLISGALVLMLIWMSLVWLLHIPRKNAGLVDVAWAAGLGLLAVFYFVSTRWMKITNLSLGTLFLSDSLPERSFLLTVMVVLWSGRLTLHLFQRNVLGSHGPVAEDPRYTELREKWRKGILFKFFLFFNAQGMANVFLSLGFLRVALAPEAPIGIWESAGLALWVIAIFGETLADRQLKKFQQDPENRGKLCQTGLWKYSRHPNYFFEWLIWVAFFVFALGSPWGWLSLGSPLLMLFLLVRVTGIPAAEALSLKKRGESYHLYQQTTRVFIPWFPKKRLPDVP